MTIFFLTILMIKILTELSPLPLNDTVVLDESLNSSTCSCSDWLLSSSQFDESLSSKEMSCSPLSYFTSQPDSFSSPLALRSPNSESLWNLVRRRRTAFCFSTEIFLVLKMNSSTVRLLIKIDRTRTSVMVESSEQLNLNGFPGCDSLPSSKS